MRNRLEPVLKLACAALAIVLLLQIVRVTLRSNPFANVSIPQIPTLSKNTNAPAAAATNSVVAKGTTNLQATAVSKVTGTNVSGPGVAMTNTNVVASAPQTVAPTNNTIGKTEGPSPGTAIVATALSLATTGGTLTVSTQVPALPTNGVVSAALAGSNSNVRVASPGGTNSAMVSGVTRPPAPRISMPAGMPGMAGGKALPELPPAIKARIDRIYESELLGQVMRPMPAALMGIAGNLAMLRSSNGQTGLVKEGDSLGEMKLLRIGVNRVLVEEKGETKELMIFNGYGGESLLSKKETPDETKAK